MIVVNKLKHTVFLRLPYSEAKVAIRSSGISWIQLAPMKLSFESFDKYIAHPLKVPLFQSNLDSFSMLHLLKVKFIKEEQLIMHCNKCLQVL